MLAHQAAANEHQAINRLAVWRYPIALLLAGHGLIHLMGVTLLWRLGQPAGLRYRQMHPTPGSPAGIIVGAGWLSAAALFVGVAILLVRRLHAWRPAAVTAALLSAAVTVPSSSVTIAGLVVDAAVLAVATAMFVAEHRRHPRLPR
jgi:uncharacterized membrane protein YhaH (DUF805 family)